MPLPSSINDLSTNASLNSPLGGEAPSLLDDYLRVYAAYIAQLRDGSGFTTAVRSNSLGSASAPAFSFVTDTNTGIFSPGADALAATTAGAERMRIDASGNVGIGVAAPTAPLHVQGSADAAVSALVQNAATSGANVAAGLNAVANDTTLRLLAYSSTHSIRGSSAWLNVNEASRSLVLATGNTERMRIDASGRVGIGVTPSSGWAASYVVAQAGVSSFLSGRVGNEITILGTGLYNDGTNWRYQLSGNFGSYYQQASGVHSWFTAPSGTAGNVAAGAEVMRVDSSGNLMMGTTAPNARVTVASSGNVPIFRPEGYANNYTSVQHYSVMLGAGNRNTTARHFAAFTETGDVFFVFGNGNVQNLNNSYAGISDIKLKENVVDATPKLDGLMRVRVVNYNLKTDPGHKQIGVIAQELQEVFPGLVEESPDRDADGNDLGTTTKSVKYSVFVPMLIKAMQEQQAQIAALTERLSALEAAAA